MTGPLYTNAGHLKHPPCAHRQAEHSALPLEGDGGGVEDVPDEARWGVPHPQNVPGKKLGVLIYFQTIENDYVRTLKMYLAEVSK